MPPTTALRRARVAVVGLFVVVGYGLATWIVNIPAAQLAVGVDDARLGRVMPFLGVGALISVQLAGRLADRFGSRVLTGPAVAAFVLAINLPGLAGSPAGLAASLFLIGFALGSLDIAMTVHAAEVERGYGRPIMSGFFGCYSIAGASAAGIAALLQSNRASMSLILATGSVLIGVIGAASVVVLRRAGMGRRDDDRLEPPAALEPVVPDPVAHAVGLPRRQVLGTIVALAVLIFALMLALGVANDWSTLQVMDRLGVSDAAASMAYATFAIALAVGRFAADPCTARLGSVTVVRAGAGLAVAGIVLVVAVPSYPLVVTGWAAFGLGISGCIPQVLGTACNLGVAKQGSVTSLIFGAGYLGMITGPLVVGAVAGRLGLNAAMLVAAGCCLVAVLLAGHVVSSRRPQRRQPSVYDPALASTSST